MALVSVQMNGDGITVGSVALMAGSGLLTSPVGLWLAQQIPNGPLTSATATLTCAQDERR